jgi:hypothetical protein
VGAFAVIAIASKKTGNTNATQTLAGTNEFMIQRQLKAPPVPKGHSADARSPRNTAFAAFMSSGVRLT